MKACPVSFYSMTLKIGIVGLPNVGKSTLFNALTRTRGAEVANYPFCTIDPNVGIVEVPDERLLNLAHIVHPEKVIPATVEFVDIAGLIRGAHKGEGLGNQFLSHIREVHAICHVVRLFDHSDVIHTEGTLDARRDRETIEMELALADLAVLQNQMQKLEGAARTKDKEKQKELNVAKKILATVEEGKPASTVFLEEDDTQIANHWSLLSQKPMLYAINCSEQQLMQLSIHDIQERLQLSASSFILPFSAKLEEELNELPEEEAMQLLRELHLTSSGLDRLITAAYRLLGYITFFTAGPKEVRAWTVVHGTKAPQAAGSIHTDFEKGFIRAETIGYEDYIAFGGEQGAREKGKLRTEGKEYMVQDGDVMHFRFNV